MLKNGYGCKSRAVKLLPPPGAAVDKPGSRCFAMGGPTHCGAASQFRANLIARATFKNLLAMWLNASEIV